MQTKNSRKGYILQHEKPPFKSDTRDIRFENRLTFYLLRRFKALNPLKYRDYRWLFMANLMSFISIGMQQITRGWLILMMTEDSPLALSFVTMAFALPMTFMSILGGALADRYPRRSLILISQSAGAFMVLVLATLDYANVIQYWHLIVIGIINGTASATGLPSRQSIISDIVPEKSLMRAIALSNFAVNLGRLAGPALAGLLIVFMGTAGVFYLIAVLQIAAFFFTSLMKTGKKTSANRDTNFFENITEGFRYAGKNRVILGLIILSLVPSIFGFPYVTLLPAWAREALDVQSDDLGWLMGVMGVGSLAGTLLLASMKNIRNKGMFLNVSGFAWGLFLFFFSMSLSFLSAYPLLFMVGFISSIFMALNNTYMQMTSSDEMRGRMVSLSMMTLGIMPLSAVPFGILAEYTGTPCSLMTAGLLLCLFMLFFFLFTQSFRKQ